MLGLLGILILTSVESQPQSIEELVSRNAKKTRRPGRMQTLGLFKAYQFEVNSNSMFGVVGMAFFQI